MPPVAHRGGGASSARRDRRNRRAPAPRSGESVSPATARSSNVAGGSSCAALVGVATRVCANAPPIEQRARPRARWHREEQRQVVRRVDVERDARAAARCAARCRALCAAARCGKKLLSPKRSGTASAGEHRTAFEPSSSRAGTMVKPRAAPCAASSARMSSGSTSGMSPGSAAWPRPCCREAVRGAGHRRGVAVARVRRSDMRAPKCCRECAQRPDRPSPPESPASSRDLRERSAARPPASPAQGSLPLARHASTGAGAASPRGVLDRHDGPDIRCPPHRRGHRRWRSASGEHVARQQLAILERQHQRMRHRRPKCQARQRMRHRRGRSYSRRSGRRNDARPPRRWPEARAPPSSWRSVL